MFEKLRPHLFVLFKFLGFCRALCLRSVDRLITFGVRRCASLTLVPDPLAVCVVHVHFVKVKVRTIRRHRLLVCIWSILSLETAQVERNRVTLRVPWSLSSIGDRTCAWHTFVRSLVNTTV